MSNRIAGGGAKVWNHSKAGKAAVVLGGTALSIGAVGGAIALGSHLGTKVGESINRNTSTTQRAKNDAEADKYNKMLGIKK